MKELSQASVQREKEAVVSKIDGGNSVRVMLPLYYEKACLSCHGEPKGEQDIQDIPKRAAEKVSLVGRSASKLIWSHLAVR